ncbi:LysM peptidoglycan-binding domain-containing protein [Neisseria brasiliensis]|uniref:LysM peptidoglycan-binding domain-containing protein n=1 Tax=Neisseria TaxID=482 RepID=UPI000C273A0E|nr:MULTISPECIES: LysM peptidoglycan-binding domain-containing protein [Neisseria]PJO78004.1 lytic transglycosylase [Neisseria sp. N177_16]QGL26108.1 LysM peptidoglycan-binding domain-containing protein [Neisseria brasiliensis]
MAKLKTIALTISGISAVSGATYAQAANNATPNQVGMAMMRLNSALLDQAKSQTFGSGSLWASLRKDFRMNEVNTELVRRHEGKFAAGRAYFDRTINRSKPYMYHIATEVKKRNMPAEIALLPFIESAYVTKAKSHVGASGLWQFMPATGRHYGLEKTALYDGRHDVYAATNAALNYLEYLHRMFGDWSLALAAYNWGEGNVGRAINRARAQGLEPTYENLRMPNETRNYVPKLLAVRNIVAHPQAYGMNVSEISNQPYFKALDIDQPIDHSAITRLANIGESEFLALNPAFNAPVFIPKANRKLLLPASAAATFEKNYRNAKPETLLSWDVYTSFSNTRLSDIAAETGMSVAEIRRLNGISGHSLSAGRSILVAKNSLSGGNNAPINFIDNDNTPDTYRSNMPEMAPIQLASNAKVADTLAANIVTPIAKSSKPIDFVSRTQAEYVAVAAAKAPVAETVVAVAEPQPASVEPTPAPVDVMAAVAQTQTVVAEAKPQAPAPMSLASGLVANAADNTAEKAVEIAVETTPEPVATEVALTEPLPLPTQGQQAEEPSQEADSLMVLVQDSTSRIQAAETVQETVAKLTEQENAAKARAARLAENKAKQQQRVATRLARAKTTESAQTVAGGMHRVAEGDTLYNISQRYNLSVADLITANNIKGNNIRKGQLLRVAAAKPKANTAKVQNVAYTVRKGDTLNTIASRFDVNVNDIRRWNKNTRTVTPGQRLKLQGS